MAQDQGGSGGGGGGETPEERNARLQAQFNQQTTTTNTGDDQGRNYSVPTVTTPSVPQTQQVELEGPLSWTVPGMPIATQETNWGQFYSQGGIPQQGGIPTQETNWGQFYSQGGQSQAPTQTSWTEQELEMLGGMSVDAAIAWGANYTGQALFGGWNVLTGEAFTGAFDMNTGELVNPDLMPSLLSPEFSNALGISEEQRIMLGYNPDYPYNLLDIPAGGGGEGGYGGYGGYGGGGGGGGGYGYSQSRRWGLTNWRIG